ncbi:anthranilate synthase component II [Tepidanaerobacter syntrophicus]|uniref:anthranilate synthase component II n=1 Tax=Tepidanaerobacter syntrophicus TaxID=224999 RepID=UPI001BD3C582|nr:aminodeoxychorismate/anthranilate synthase component II [Tepidanaerobacter syntrophicus]
MILVIDNYDSFSYNLYQLAGMLDCDAKIFHNNEITIEDIKKLNPSHIIISSGPGYPESAGICMDAVRELEETKPILGVGLGHQVICKAYGADIIRAKKIMHGKQCEVIIDNENPLFFGMPSRIKVARYNSLKVLEDNFPCCLEIIAKTNEEEIMAIKHRDYPIFGLQFHPESILTPDGPQIIKNFVNILKGALL